MSRRWRYPRSRRGSFFAQITTQAAPTVPPYVPSIQEPSGRNPRPRTTRRGQFFRVVSAVVAQYIPGWQEPSGRNSRPRVKSRGRFYPVVPAVVVQVAFVPSVMEPSGRNSRPRGTRRGKFYSVPSASVAAVAVWVPPFQDTHRAPARPVRRGEFQTVVPSVIPATSLLPSVQRPSTRRGAAVKRGRFYGVPAAGILAGPGPLPPTMQRPPTRRSAVVRRGRFYVVPGSVVPAGPGPCPLTFAGPSTRRLAAPKRGRFFAIPLTGAVPAAPTAIPQVLRARVKVLFVRKARFWVPVPQQTVTVQTWLPSFTRARRTPVLPVRRGDYQVIPPLRTGQTHRIRSRRCGLPAVRRGHMWTPSWVYVPPPPPTAGTASGATGPVPTGTAAAGQASTATGASSTAATANPAVLSTASASAGVMTVPTATGG